MPCNVMPSVCIIDSCITNTVRNVILSAPGNVSSYYYLQVLEYDTNSNNVELDLTP
jgi:hypothetical protein